ncbi:bifunctional threonine ammonia-lyase/L-serine ammonia-lyase TdcB [Latilactobacillus fuchuensis]|uniref:L-threonine dehydratase catabolic TdcB n=2 Tax=Latilactobacillus fuchuensis TaxID=164393 RepID=A0A2N9DUB3_9LACO|nr:bifunctional threonine ammonia-lyase/L-serine ammonia-lyase TdcB [Latilactobacillus fuchuensis]KRL61613.1 tdcB protein [Latilactobacillus fuchuensis DSM 14340 = JCM 11249]MCP8857039.1 bifunctional threonine ammonia-lyase/L-serine ammonia-lyase TdcB [Latilactobacillus fuchuensis]SPC37620.1 catabolic threonine dehydratase, PLP-dependent [Latilactobacillus fuchuensis]
MATNDLVSKTADICNIQDIEEARAIIKPYARETPLIQSMFLSRNVTKGNVFLKMENMQLTGSFKFRGANNKINHLTAEQRERGIVTASAGNHAQGVALTAKILGIDATVVMPEEAPLAKQQATAGYGANVVLHGETFNDARLYMEQLAEEKGLTIVHPYDDREVMAGQGTIGLEILDKIWNVDTVIVPVGGGGLISGVATALKSFNPSIHIIGVQSENVHGMDASYELGEITSHHDDFTLADGTDVAIPGNLTFPVVQNLVDEFVLVTEDEIAMAMTDLMQRAKIVTEGAGALPTAALISGKVDPKWLEGKNIVALVSGGNVDLTRVSGIIDHLFKPADTSKGVVG